MLSISIMGIFLRLLDSSARYNCTQLKLTVTACSNIACIYTYRYTVWTMSLCLWITSSSVMGPPGYRRKLRHPECYSHPDNLTSHKAQEKKIQESLWRHDREQPGSGISASSFTALPWDYIWQNVVESQFPAFQEGLQLSHPLWIPASNPLL